MARRKSTGGRVNQMSPTKGRIGSKNPNKRAVITVDTGPGKVRILRALDPLTYKTLQRQAPGAVAETLNNPQVTKNQVIQRGRQLLAGSRQGVRRLYRRDPYNIWSATAPPPFGTNATVAQFAPEAEKVDILNTNTAFHPEAGGPSPSSITVVRQAQPTMGRKNRGKVMVPNRITLFGGKTLRRV